MIVSIYATLGYILDVFGKLGESPQAVDPDWLRSVIEAGGHIFVVPSQWEKKLGVRLFDHRAIESGCVLRYLGPFGGYQIFIDGQQNTVYIHAFCC
jgi:hypothetical protein